MSYDAIPYACTEPRVRNLFLLVLVQNIETSVHLHNSAVNLKRMLVAPHNDRNSDSVKYDIDTRVIEKKYIRK